ncbi:MAG: AraC family ligand binding domain-containing protein [Gemmatimonadetes bacterium]|nr:AraC family ligand binding domain-containing protein [Gemmatimonadota bacterium]
MTDPTTRLNAALDHYKRKTAMPKVKIVAIILFAFPTLAIAQESVPPALYTAGTDITSALATAVAARPSMAASRIEVGEHYRINLIRRTEAAGAIVHRPGTELHYITDGAGTLVTGGIVVRPAGGGQGNIEGGLARQVTKGDAILIPEGTPHQYTAVEGSITYLEVRFNVPIE